MSKARENRRAAAHQRAAARAGRLTARRAMRPATGGRGRVSYQGSATGGYGSEWAAPANVSGQIKPIVIDRRWDDTASRNPA